MAANSIHRAYATHGSGGLTEAGQIVRREKITKALGGAALTVTGLAVAVVVMLVFMDVIPGMPPHSNYLSDKIMYFDFGLMADMVPIGGVVWGIIFIVNNSLYLRGNRTPEEKARFLTIPEENVGPLQCPKVAGFDAHKIL